MHTLLINFLKCKYKIDDEKTNELINQSIKNGDLVDWYKIAIISFEEEMNKFCK